MSGHFGVGRDLHTKKCAMHEFLSERVGQLERLATTIRTGLDQAESAIPCINQQFAELARLGMSDFQIEGPTKSVACPRAERWVMRRYLDFFRCC